MLLSSIQRHLRATNVVYTLERVTVTWRIIRFTTVEVAKGGFKGEIAKAQATNLLMKKYNLRLFPDQFVCLSARLLPLKTLWIDIFDLRIYFFYLY